MSQIKNSSKLFEQHQILKELCTFDPELEVEKFLGGNSSIIEPLVEIVLKLKETFPESELVLSLPVQSTETQLIISIYPVAISMNVLGRFNDFKEIWWSENYDGLREKVSLNLEHQDFVTSGNPWKAIENLVGSVEGPEDWATEHDHYLYGTPKINQ